MDVVESMFIIQHDKNKFRVIFTPGRVTVEQVGHEVALLVLGNANGRWKPCATHAREVLRLALGKRPATQHAANRIEAAGDYAPGDVLPFARGGA